MVIKIKIVVKIVVKKVLLVKKVVLVKKFVVMMLIFKFLKDMFIKVSLVSYLVE